MSLISQSEAAARLGISRQAIGKLKDQIPRPGFFIEDNGKLKVETEHPEWKKKETVYGAIGITKKLRNQKNSNARKKQIERDAVEEEQEESDRQDEQGEQEDTKLEKPDREKKEVQKPEKGKQQEKPKKKKTKKESKENILDNLPEGLKELGDKAAVADIKKIIFTTAIKEEQAKQEQIKTLAIQKDLAPIYLVKYFFSFSEKLIQKIYSKPHDLEPQLGALFLAKENKKATQLLVRELESIVIDVQRELLQEIEKEGYEIEKVKDE